MARGRVRVNLDFRSNTRELDRAYRTLNQFKNVFVGLIAGGTLAYMTKQTLDNVDAMAKFSDATGIATEKLSALRYAADLNGASFEKLKVGLRTLNKNVFDFANGTGEARIAFQRLGISARDAEGELKQTDEILLEIAEKFQDMPDGVEKSALAMRLFGESGTALVPLLNQGAEGIAGLTAEAESLGIVINRETAREFEQFNDNLTRIKYTVQGMVQTFLEEALPAINAFSEGLGKNVTEQGLLTGAARTLGEVVGYLLIGLEALITVAMRAAESIGQFYAVISLMAEGKFIAANDAMNQLKATMLQTLDDLVSISERVGREQENIIDIEGVTARNMTMWEEIKAGAIEATEAINQGIEDYITRLGTLFDQIRREFTTIMSGIEGGLANSIEGLIRGTMTWGEALRNIGSTIVNEIIASFARMAARFLMEQVFMRAAMATTSAIGDALRTKEVAAENAADTAKMGPKLINATLSSIGSYGLAVGIGLAALAAAMAAFGGFAEGGFTGSGGKFEPAGVVHKGEFVIPADVTSRMGVGNLYAMMNGVRSGGYAEGGLVGMADTPSSTVNVSPAPVQIAVLNSEQQLGNYMRSTAGQKVFVDLMKQNRFSIGAGA